MNALRMRVAVFNATFLIHPVQTGESQAYFLLWSLYIYGSMTNAPDDKKDKSFNGLV